MVRIMRMVRMIEGVEQRLKEFLLTAFVITVSNASVESYPVACPIPSLNTAVLVHQ